MTASEQGTSPSESLPSRQGRRERWRQRWQRIEAKLERWSERLNPILVKEARQALKSRQFIATFSLLLLAGWLWSIIGIVSQQGSSYYAARGDEMLVGYFIILTVPLLVVVPFSAYRSLASEREDGTFELVSISTLRASQIVRGKMGSAMLQMMIYFSAISPCIAFTYMLRGIDIVTILSVLTYTVLLSVLVSLVGVFMATISMPRTWLPLVSVVVVAFLFFTTWGWITVVVELFVFDTPPFDRPLFWSISLAYVTLYFTYLWLLYSAASARLSFASDNQATGIRIALFAQQILFVGWMAYFWIWTSRYQSRDSPIPLLILITAGPLHWYLIGTMCVGESGFLSPRVRRSLPKTALGRAFLTWFIPGSGSAYGFVVSNVVATYVFFVIALIFNGQLAIGTTPAHLMWYGALITCYVIAYLGLVRLCVVYCRRFSPVGIPFSFLLGTLLPLLGIGAPFLLDYWLQGYSFPKYGPLHATNPVWSVITSLTPRQLGRAAAQPLLFGFPLCFYVVPVATAFIYAMNLLTMSDEVIAARQDAPRRVQLDDQELHPQPEAPQRKSPWD